MEAVTVVFGIWNLCAS